MEFSRQEYWSGVPLPSLIIGSRFIHLIRTDSNVAEASWGIYGLNFKCSVMGQASNAVHSKIANAASGTGVVD